jgi:hypothetical protein
MLGILWCALPDFMDLRLSACYAPHSALDYFRFSIPISPVGNARMMTTKDNP